ncbi:hypothetical protein ACFQ0B_33475 [Nonomuraea thailandensis]
MRVILFGATGMIGRGVLRECLLDGRVTAVLAVGRAPAGVAHGKLREILHDDLLDLAPVEGSSAGTTRASSVWGSRRPGCGSRTIGGSPTTSRCRRVGRWRGSAPDRRSCTCPAPGPTPGGGPCGPG